MREAAKPLLRLSGLCKVFREGERERTVLRNADLSIETGQWIALLGRSGSGKSTFLNLLAGIDAPTRGRLEYQGIDLSRLDERQRTLWRRQNVGFIFQFFNLIPTLTVAENVLLPLELLGRRGGKQEEQALARLQTLGLGERLSSFPDVLSGGEQQRVAIARALAHDPPLVLADEPTGNLDEESAAQVMDLLESVARSDGKALLLVTHSRQVASRADRILRLQDGQFRDESP